MIETKKQLNTVLFLQYRDGDNYKHGMHVVLTGEMSQSEWDRVRDALMKKSLYDVSAVIAHQVGLPSPSFYFMGCDDWPNQETDHVFTEIENFEEDFDPDNQLTIDHPTLSMTGADFVARIESVVWDIAAEKNRMEVAGRQRVSVDPSGEYFCALHDGDNGGYRLVVTRVENKFLPLLSLPFAPWADAPTVRWTTDGIDLSGKTGEPIAHVSLTSETFQMAKAMAGEDPDFFKQLIANSAVLSWRETDARAGDRPHTA